VNDVVNEEETSKKTEVEVSTQEESSIVEDYVK
jgi:hypothetical protein